MRTYYPGTPDVPREYAVMAGILFALAVGPAACLLLLKFRRADAAAKSIICAPLYLACYFIITNAVSVGLLVPYGKVHDFFRYDLELRDYVGTIFTLCLLLFTLFLTWLSYDVPKWYVNKYSHHNSETETSDTPTFDPTGTLTRSSFQAASIAFITLGTLLVYTQLFQSQFKPTYFRPGNNLSVVTLKEPDETACGRMVLYDGKEVVIHGFMIKGNSLDPHRVLSIHARKVADKIDAVKAMDASGTSDARENLELWEDSNLLLSERYPFTYRIPASRVLNVLDLTPLNEKPREPDNWFLREFINPPAAQGR